MHVILDLLDQDLGDPQGGLLYRQHPQLAERCYHLIYRLSSTPKTSLPTMRYLRSRDNFFVKHLRSLPIGPTFETEETSTSARQELRFDSLGNFSRSNENVEEIAFISRSQCRAWLLKSVALELHVSSAQKQVRQTQDLLSLLFSNPAVNDGKLSSSFFSETGN